MIRIAVCDDDTEFLKSIVSIIEDWSGQSRIPVEICCFDNGDDLITQNTIRRIDIIFLDIIMPLFSGMETAKEIRKRDTAVQIIFLTSSPEFALESYDVKAKGYLLKPVDEEKLRELLYDCSHNLQEERHLVLKTKFGYQKLYYHDIEYIEVQNKVVIKEEGKNGSLK